jgi:hypothetical protein
MSGWTSTAGVVNKEAAILSYRDFDVPELQAGTLRSFSGLCADC